MNDAQPTKSTEILVFGATGNQGGAVAQKLLAFGFPVRALARDPESEAAQALAVQGATLAEADYTDRASLEAAMQGVYGAYVCLPFFTEDFGREVKMGQNAVDAAESTGVSHLIYSAGSRSNERTGVPHLDSKGEVERYLRASGVPYTVLRPVAFNYSLAAYREPVVGGRLPDARDPESLLYQVDERDHATFAAMAFLDPGAWLYRGFDTASEALTVRELAEAFGRVVGREVEVAPISWEEEAEMDGEEVVRLAQWVEREGPQIDMAARRERYPWLTRTEDYLRAHGWTNAAAAEEQPA